MEEITKKEAIDALAATAHHGEDRITIHSFLGGIGADHDLARAVELVQSATSVGWVDHWIGHNLAVVVGDRTFHYDVRRPETETEGST